MIEEKPQAKRIKGFGFVQNSWNKTYPLRMRQIVPDKKRMKNSTC